MSPRITPLSEDALIAALQQKLAAPPEGTTGIGDDCAVLEQGQLLKTDCVVEGKHYLPDTPAHLIGRKAVARVLSDIAAMGGTPEYILITCGLRPDTPLSYIEELYDGINTLCREHQTYVMGGETVVLPSGSAPFYSISGYGRADTPILRSTAQVGDLIYVTGSLGNTFLSEHHLLFTPRLQEAQWLCQHACPSAMMDLSDGLARDLPRLAHMSHIGYQIDLESLPLRAGATIESALSDGEDYELLFTLPPHLAPHLSQAPFTCTHIGQMTETTASPLSGGWDHLAPSP